MTNIQNWTALRHGDLMRVAQDRERAMEDHDIPLDDDDDNYEDRSGEKNHAAYNTLYIYFRVTQRRGVPRSGDTVCWALFMLTSFRRNLQV